LGFKGLKWKFLLVLCIIIKIKYKCLYFRGCTVGYDVGCVVQKNYLGHKEEFCVCDENECNASSSLSISMFALMTSSLLLTAWELL